LAKILSFVGIVEIRNEWDVINGIKSLSQRRFLILGFEHVVSNLSEMATNLNETSD
jgi:hypothetical protein